jgi:hypothetical protein
MGWWCRGWSCPILAFSYEDVRSGVDWGCPTSSSAYQVVALNRLLLTKRPHEVPPDRVGNLEIAGCSRMNSVGTSLFSGGVA